MKITKEEIIKRSCNAHQYFTNRLFENVIFKRKIDFDIIKENCKKIFKDVDDFSAFDTFTKEEVISTPGMGIWTGSDTTLAVCLTPAFIHFLPEDFELKCVLDGEEKADTCKVKDLQDYDTRFGYTAWGFFSHPNTKFPRYSSTNH